MARGEQIPAGGEYLPQPTEEDFARGREFLDKLQNDLNELVIPQKSNPRIDSGSLLIRPGVYDKEDRLFVRTNHCSRVKEGLHRRSGQFRDIGMPESVGATLVEVDFLEVVIPTYPGHPANIYAFTIPQAVGDRDTLSQRFRYRIVDLRNMDIAQIHAEASPE